ncbi:hypothetical protein EJB05_50287, partial [Eragrostis curvula]
MYKTKPLSLFKSHPDAATQPPPEGQSSGYLVIDDDPATDDTGCWGTCCPTRLWGLPFPQNRVLSVVFSGDLADHAVVFVPVPDQPLASNRYYAVVASGRSRGLVRTCSREEDMATCFCRCIKDVKPRPFDPADVYQQMEIVQRKPGLFTARAVAADGFPPLPYRYKDWQVYQSRNNKFDLKLEEPGPGPTTNTAVGRWYFPFFYLINKEDGVSLRRQMDRSAFYYEVVLEKRWEPVRTLGGGSKLVSRKALIGGSVEAKQEAVSSRHGDGAEGGPVHVRVGEDDLGGVQGRVARRGGGGREGRRRRRVVVGARGAVCGEEDGWQRGGGL